MAKHKNFEIAPHALTRDTSLSLGARALYPLLRDLAWRAGRRSEEQAVELPTMESIATELGCATSTCRSYIAELREAGWVITLRASRRRPTQWIICADPSAPESRGLAKSECAEKRAPSAPESDNPSSLVTDTSYGETTSLPEAPPAIVMVDGRNLPLDALTGECGIDPASPRMGHAIAALNGRGKEPGIRHLFWEEARRWATEHDDLDRLADLQEDPARFARALEAAIRRKAGKYRENLHGATMSPTALRDWWLDLELARAQDGGLSSDDMRRRAQ